MASYGVQTTNLFDLLDDDGPQQKSASKGAEKKSAEPAKPKVGAKKEAAMRAAAEESSAAAKPKARRDMPEAPQLAPRENRSDRGRGNGRGRGRGRGGFADRGKREFDRQGAPRSKAPGVPTKGGHALGSPTDAIAAAESTEEAAAAEESAAVEAPAAVEEIVEIDEDDLTLTYDQFVAQQKTKLVVDDLEKKLRTVEVDDKKWKTGKCINPGEKPAVEEEKKAVHQASKPKKQIISLDEFVGDMQRAPAPRREREFNPENGSGNYRGRGGRGRGAGAGAPRGGRGRPSGPSALVNPSDETAFPKLGK